MQASGSHSASPSIQAQHVASQYRLQAAHLGLQKTSAAAFQLAGNAGSLLHIVQGNQGASGTRGGTGMPYLDSGMLATALQTAENSLRKIADESSVLDKQVLSLFPQAEGLDVTTPADFKLTENTGDFMRNADELVDQVRVFALKNNGKASRAICAIEAAGPSVSKPLMVVDHTVLAQMNILSHL